MTYRICGMPGCGNTYLHQIIGSLLENSTNNHNSGHGYVEKKEGEIYLVPYRDFRDVLCSTARRQFKTHSQNTSISSGIKMSHESLLYDMESISKWLKRPDANMIRYEDYYPDNTRQLFTFLQDELGFVMDDKDIDIIMKEWSLENNKVRASQYKSFKQHNKNTNIHGDHISNDGNPGAWKELMTDEIKEFLKPRIDSYLIETGYITEGEDW